MVQGSVLKPENLVGRGLDLLPLAGLESFLESLLVVVAAAEQVLMVVRIRLLYCFLPYYILTVQLETLKNVLARRDNTFGMGYCEL